VHGSGASIGDTSRFKGLNFLIIYEYPQPEGFPRPRLAKCDCVGDRDYCPRVLLFNSTFQNSQGARSELSRALALLLRVLGLLMCVFRVTLLFTGEYRRDVVVASKFADGLVQIGLDQIVFYIASLLESIISAIKNRLRFCKVC